MTDCARSARSDEYGDSGTQIAGDVVPSLNGAGGRFDSLNPKARAGTFVWAVRQPSLPGASSQIWNKQINALPFLMKSKA